MSSLIARVVRTSVTISFLLLSSGVHASSIRELNVPSIIRNGTGPIDLSCIYEIKENENGLVVKWFHNFDQIYQWIPPMPPQDLGVIRGATVYPEENLKEPNSRSIIRLREVRTEMGGEYVCVVSTFQEEVAQTSKMTVYAPETEAWIYISPFNETHLIFTCLVNGAFPQPTIKIYIEGVEAESISYETNRSESPDEENLYSIKWQAIVENFMDPALIDCEISIPETDYKNRERMVYYPVQYLAQTSVASEKYPSFRYTSLELLFYLLHYIKNRIKLET